MATDNDKTVMKELQTAEILNKVAQLLQEIRFGSVELIIHEGRVVQIDRKEKLRFDHK